MNTAVCFDSGKTYLEPPDFLSRVCQDNENPACQDMDSDKPQQRTAPLLPPNHLLPASLQSSHNLQHDHGRIATPRIFR